MHKESEEVLAKLGLPPPAGPKNVGLHFGSVKNIIMPGGSVDNKKRGTAEIRTDHLSKEFDTVMAGGYTNNCSHKINCT